MNNPTINLVGFFISSQYLYYMSKLLNETFQKHLKLLHKKLKLKESELKYGNVEDREYLDNMGRGDDVDVLDYFNQIWEEITDLKEKYSTYSFNQCLKDSRTFIDFFDTLVSVHVNIDDFDFKNCPDVGDELNDIERKKYNKLVNDLYNRWKQTYGGDEKPDIC